MDYDRYSDTLPVLGTAAGVAMDGAHFTPSINTALYNEEEVKCLEQARAAAQGNVLELSSAKGKRAVG